MATVQCRVRIRGLTVEDNKAGKGRDRLAGRGEVLELKESLAKEYEAEGYVVILGDEPEEEDAGKEGEFDADVPELSDDELDEWITGAYTDRPPSVDKVIEAAKGEAESAERLLASEYRVAASQERGARSTLEKELSEIAGSSAGGENE